MYNSAGEVGVLVAAAVADGVSVKGSAGVAGRASGEVGTSLAWFAALGVGEGAMTGLAGLTTAGDGEGECDPPAPALSKPDGNVLAGMAAGDAAAVAEGVATAVAVAAVGVALGITPE